MKLFHEVSPSFAIPNDIKNFEQTSAFKFVRLHCKQIRGAKQPLNFKRKTLRSRPRTKIDANGF